MQLRRVILVLAALLGSLLVAIATAADAKPPSTTSGADCNLPESDAEALVILNYYYPNRYVWEDTELTVAVRAAPSVDQDYVAAAREAIAAWDAVLRECFDDQITLTDVTGQSEQPDIVVHYVPYAGGTVFAGYAICGANGCPNILVRSDFATSDDYTPEYLFYVTLHELGHALGLGHATNLRESMDLMGYEWIGSAPDPVFSQCDLDAIAYLFGDLLAGEGPAGPGPSQLEPTFDCAGA